MGRLGKSVELALVYIGREGIAPFARWVAAGVGTALPLMPVVRTTYLGFAFTCCLAIWLKWRGEKLSDFGLLWPRQWLRSIAWGFAIFAMVVLYGATVAPMLQSVLEPIFGPSQGAETFHFIRGRLDLFLFVLPCIWIFAALGEEFLYRGYMMTRLTEIFGGGRGGFVAALLVQAVLFGLGHFYQGWTGVIEVTIYGVIYGLAARVAGRNLLPAMIAHGSLDTLGFTLIFLGLM